MRLLNVKTRRLEDFADERSAPLYAILSHTWSSRELQYRDLASGSWNELDVAFNKIRLLCEQARIDGYDYVWLDTCCIDKSSSAELTEAINSMFRWYQKSEVCYVFLTDVGVRADAMCDDDFEARNAASARVGFGYSRWFTRGWTLQELLAPKRVVFYNKFWVPLGDSTQLIEQISAASGISADVLNHDVNLSEVSVAAKMSWASRRKTTRVEDEAYCLLGIFDVNMPMLYGEGSKAFIRLQEEIIRHSADQSIFAWSGPECQLLAPSSSHFAGSGTIRLLDEARGETYEMTNRGLRITTEIVPEETSCLLLLDCVDEKDVTKVVALRLMKTFEKTKQRTLEISFAQQYGGHELQHVSHDEMGDHRRSESILIVSDYRDETSAWNVKSSPVLLILRGGDSELMPTAPKVELVFPEPLWDMKTQIMTPRKGTASQQDWAVYLSHTAGNFGILLAQRRRMRNKWCVRIFGGKMSKMNEEWHKWKGSAGILQETDLDIPVASLPIEATLRLVMGYVVVVRVMSGPVGLTKDGLHVVVAVMLNREKLGIASSIGRRLTSNFT